MTVTLVVTAVGKDQPGLVSTLSEIAHANGGNWEASRMAQMAGRFAGIFEISVEEDKAKALESALGQVEGLRTVVERSDDEPGAGEDRRGVALELIGADHPGILNGIMNALASRSVNVEELSTEISSAPMTGDPLFTLTAELSAPRDLDLEKLRADLEALAADLMVELDMAADV
jgi:glycine cleavage system regulatory protein